QRLLCSIRSLSDLLPLITLIWPYGTALMPLTWPDRRAFTRAESSLKLMIWSWSAYGPPFWPSQPPHQSLYALKTERWPALKLPNVHGPVPTGFFGSYPVGTMSG